MDDPLTSLRAAFKMVMLQCTPSPDPTAVTSRYPQISVGLRVMDASVPKDEQFNPIRNLVAQFTSLATLILQTAPVPYHGFLMRRLIGHFNEGMESDPSAVAKKMEHLKQQVEIYAQEKRRQDEERAREIDELRKQQTIERIKHAPLIFGNPFFDPNQGQDNNDTDDQNHDTPVHRDTDEPTMFR